MLARSICHYWSAHSAKNVAESSNKIAIITDDPGWHGRTLTNALKKHGYHSQYVSLTDCRIQISESVSTVALPGFEDALPIGVFVRGVPGGSLEQVIFRLNILHILQDMGVTVFNTGRAIERTVDKSMTSYLLHKQGLSSPATFVVENKQQALTLLNSYSSRSKNMVIKPLFGSQGIGVEMATADLIDEHNEDYHGLFYLQEFIEPKTDACQDIRVLVIDGEARYAMLRQGQSWKTNRTQGATCLPVTIDSRISELAQAAASAVDIDYCGVDIIVDKNDTLHVLEINSIPAWWGLQKVVEKDIATALIQSFVKKIQTNKKHVYSIHDGGS